MLDIPIVQATQEYIVNEFRAFQSSNEALYQMSEVDLSFCDALASMCSSETSSGPSTHKMVIGQVEKNT